MVPCFVSGLPYVRPVLQEVLHGNYGLELEKEDLHAGGVNYGDFIFEDNTLVMKLDEKPVLELPLAVVSQCVLPGNSKNEVELQVGKWWTLSLSP